MLDILKNKGEKTHFLQNIKPTLYFVLNSKLFKKKKKKKKFYQKMMQSK